MLSLSLNDFCIVFPFLLLQSLLMMKKDQDGNWIRSASYYNYNYRCMFISAMIWQLLSYFDG